MLPQSKTKEGGPIIHHSPMRLGWYTIPREVWDYRRIIGKLNFLEKSTRLEIMYEVHQYTRLANNPRQSHANAVKYLCQYLLAT
jgi:hypothetical protein